MLFGNSFTTLHLWLGSCSAHEQKVSPQVQENIKTNHPAYGAHTVTLEASVFKMHSLAPLVDNLLLIHGTMPPIWSLNKLRSASAFEAMAKKN